MRDQRNALPSWSTSTTLETLIGPSLGPESLDIETIGRHSLGAAKLSTSYVIHR